MDTFVVRGYIYILKYQVSVNKQARYVITLEGRYLKKFSKGVVPSKVPRRYLKKFSKGRINRLCE